MNALVIALVKILETMFLVGMAGSSIVLLLTTIDDLATIFEKDATAPIDAPPAEA